MTKKQSKGKKKVKKNIKKAVQEIPDLIVEEMEKEKDKARRNTEQLKKYSKREQKVSIKPVQESKKNLLYIGATILASIIFFMWIWNIQSMVYDVMQYKKTHVSPLTQAKEDFGEIMVSAIKTPEDENAELEDKKEEEFDTDSIKQTIKNILQSAIKKEETASGKEKENTTSTQDNL